MPQFRGKTSLFGRISANIKGKWSIFAYFHVRFVSLLVNARFNF